MKRLFTVALLAALASILVMPAFAQTPEKPIELSFSFHAPKESSLAKAVIIPWANRIMEATGGRVKIVLYPSGSLLSSSAEFDGVVSGMCDIAQINTEEYPGRFPLCEINTLPYIYPNLKVAGAVAHEIALKYCSKTEMKDVKVLLAGALHGTAYFGNKPIRTMSDCKGVKLRVAGKMAMDIYTTLGFVPVNVSTSDVFSALDKGLIDGATYSWSGGLAVGIKDVTKYRTDLGFSGGVQYFVMNKKAFEKLPSDIQKIFDEICTPEYSGELSEAHAKFAAGAKATLEASDSKAGRPPITVISPEESAKWKKALQPLEDKWVKDHGAAGKEVMAAAKKLIQQYSK